MSVEDIHFMGIKVVYSHLIDNGYDVLQVRKEIDIDPQILAKKENRFVLVVVKTAVYPKMGVLSPNVAVKVQNLAIEKQALSYFASVGIANANGESDSEMAMPILNGEYYINFNGLVPITIF